MVVIVIAIVMGAARAVLVEAIVIVAVVNQVKQNNQEI